MNPDNMQTLPMDIDHIEQCTMFKAASFADLVVELSDGEDPLDDGNDTVANDPTKDAVLPQMCI